MRDISLRFINRMMTTQPALLVQQRAILSQLGITLWAGKHTPTTILAQPQSDNTPSTPVLPDAIGTLAKQFAVRQQAADNQSMADQSVLPPPKIQPQGQTQASVQTKTDTKPVDLTSSTPAVQIAYHLQAIRYQNWLLIADANQMSVDAKTVWLSLSAALQRYAEQNRGIFASRQLQFPFDEMGEQQGGQVQLAQSGFLGLVFGLTQANFEIGICLLTPLPAFLQLPMQAYGQFAIADMAIDVNLKKQFWQFLHSTAG